MPSETVRINSCPHCGLAHIYKLAVERSVVMRALIMDNLYERYERPEEQVRYTRLFMCPNKLEKFQANITLTQTSSSQILGVDVVGLAEAEDV